MTIHPSVEAVLLPSQEPGRNPEDLTPVGGCNGILLVPDAGLADYYRAHGYAAICACALLALIALIRLAL